MPEFLKHPFVNGPAIAPLDVVIRLVIALGLGAVVGLIYCRTRKSTAASASLTVTLVLLTILIAIVTQVIGERELMSIATARQGICLDLIYQTRLRPSASVEDLVKSLNRIEGVQSVQLQQRDFAQN